MKKSDKILDEHFGNGPFARNDLYKMTEKFKEDAAVCRYMLRNQNRLLEEQQKFIDRLKAERDHYKALATSQGRRKKAVVLKLMDCENFHGKKAKINNNHLSVKEGF